MSIFGTQGELERLRIRAFRDARCEQEQTDLGMTVMLNPETLSLNYGISFAENAAPNNSAANRPYDRSQPMRVDFDFLFDRTGAVPAGPPQPDGVQPDLDKLKTILTGYGDAIHSPYYLIVNWGRFNLRCKLATLQLTYKLFRADGTPLRASAHCAFEEFREAELRVAEENQQSPDVTHVREVPESEHLPYMTFKIYGDSKHYLEVARANGIVNFRRLKTGSSIRFPPIEK